MLALRRRQQCCPRVAKRILFIKKEGGSRWGWGLSVTGWGGRIFSRLPMTHFSLPPILRDGAGDLDGVI